MQVCRKDARYTGSFGETWENVIRLRPVESEEHKLHKLLLLLNVKKIIEGRHCFTLDSHRSDPSKQT